MSYSAENHGIPLLHGSCLFLFLHKMKAMNVIPLAVMRVVSRFAAAVLALSLFASCARRSGLSIFPDGVELHEGDIVFRRGNGLTSRAVLAADRHGLYSHVGIVVDSCGVMMVVHAVPGEPDYDGDPDRVKMEPPEKFFISLNADIGEVKRLRGDTVAPSVAARKAVEIYRRGTLFDHDYDDTDTTRMYCCELVMHAYACAGVALVGTSRHDFRLPGLGIIRCVLPSDICNYRRLTTVAAF